MQFDEEWVRRLRGAVGVARAAGGALAIVLVLGAAFTIANVVRLTILLHREEIEMLRLVGAPEFLIRGPFVVGALIQGLLGGLLALGLLGLGYRALLLWGSRGPENVVALLGLRFLPPETAGVLVGFGVVAGLLGGAFSRSGAGTSGRRQTFGDVRRRRPRPSSFGSGSGVRSPRRAAQGANRSKRSPTTLTVAVRGTARMAPGTPQRIPQKRNATRTASGWSRTRLPTMNGVRTFPSRNWTTE